jgi:hypothetical protein
MLSRALFGSGNTFSEVFKIVFLRGMVYETLEIFAKNDTDRMQLHQFIADWSGNFMLQSRESKGVMEATLKHHANIINTSLYNLARISDTGLMELIHEMRELSKLLYVYSNQTFLLQRKHGIDLTNFRNTIYWTSEILDRHIISKYNINTTPGSGAPAAAGR